MVNMFCPFQFTINMNTKIFITGDLFQAIIIHKNVKIEMFTSGKFFGWTNQHAFRLGSIQF